MRAAIALDTEGNEQDAMAMADMFETIDTCPVPVIARVHGAALGGGMGLCAVADLVIAESGTRFGFTETRLGILPAVISPFVIAKIGESHARALFPGGRRFDATRAARIGLVHEIVEGDEALDAAVEAAVADLLAAGPTAARAAKAIVREVRGLGHGSAKWHTARVIARQRTSDEAQEGFRAFTETRGRPGRPIRLRRGVRAIHAVRPRSRHWALRDPDRVGRAGSSRHVLPGRIYATIATPMAEELSPSQAAARIGATTRSVQRWIASGRLPARRVGGRWRVATDAIDAFVARGEPVAATARGPRSDALHRQPRRDRDPDHADLRPARDPRGRARPPTARTRSTCSTSPRSSPRRGPPAPTRSTPASGSWPRTPTSPRR